MTDPCRMAAVVSAYRKQETLERCLSSIQAVMQRSEDLIFVDNGSAEGIGKWATRRFPDITVVRVQQNRLYCGGVNEGIRVAMKRGYDFILLFNADTEVINQEFPRQLLETARRRPRAAFIGPLVFYRSREVFQKTCLQFPTVWRNTVIWLPWRVARRYILRQPQVEKEVEFLNGVCILCRVSALKEFGLLDENMGGYVEDADWAWRARESGWASVFSPVPSIIHHEEPVGYDAYSMKTFLLKRNTVLWYLKTGRRVSAYAYACAAMALSWVRMVSEFSKCTQNKHRYFIHVLYRSYRGLFRGDELGEWFGPPLGGWDDKVVTSSWI